jgi:uncharacterized protein (TIGR03437 family)
VRELFKIKHLLAIALIGTGTLWAQSAGPLFDVLNATSNQPSLSPGVVAVLFGEALTPPDQIGCVFSEQFGWATNLHGVQVMVNQVPAPIAVHCRLPQSAGTSLEVLTCQFPAGLPAGEAEIVVTVNGVASAPLQVTLQPYAPALGEFYTQGGQKLGAFRHAQSGQLVTSAAPAMPGEVLSVVANGLGGTAPAVAEGKITPPPSPRTVATPLVDINGQPAEVLGAALRIGHVGVYDVTFRVPSPLAAGTYVVHLTMGGIVSNEVALVVTQPGAGPSISAIVSAGSFEPQAPAAPGSILSLFAANLTGQTGSGLFPVTAFAGLSVTFNGVRAPLFAVVPEANQINVLAPSELAEKGQVDVRITTAQGTSAVFPLQMTTASPGIFRINDPTDPGRQFAAALLANTAWLAIPDSVAEALGMPAGCAENGIDPKAYCGEPLRPGEYLQLFLTGLGRATPDGNPDSPTLATGQVAPAGGALLYHTVLLPEVRIGGMPAQVAFSGLTPGYAGLYQINAIVPQGIPAGDMVPIQVTTPNGLTDTAMIAVQAPQ